VTGLLTTCGSQFHDWTSSYRLFSRPRLPVETLFTAARRAVISQLAPGAPVCAVLDDTLLRRSGLRTPGVAWRRDPLGPRFQTNFVRAQRFLQTSLALPLPEGWCRMIPVAFRHAPTPLKPSKKATASEQKQYRAQARAARLSQRAAEQIRDLRAALDADPSSAARRLLAAFDGGYTMPRCSNTFLPTPPPSVVCAKMRIFSFGRIPPIRKPAAADSATARPRPPPSKSAPTIHLGKPSPSFIAAPLINCASSVAPA
jgi:hypothetical protein